ncbi:helix-turn-helix domain-containing protein [Alteraurantiacibacter aquimixticola]|uniref:Helix-turn-helix domain-containing protein n=1 Tax=Alteraurantiacibacter aquimixticola TaxID=2489173 RepID=A0A4T3F1B9_9SPHN|nr:helix-turn-helix domain-containing protein [Alteraurantiacibacter aquimixticola]TIX50946.1 helix-turn-helix domain-containing protein [Alteraurantiacibacter aquimixticola]
MELLSTKGLPVNGRAAAWAELYATRMSACEFTPQDGGEFAAELRIGSLGPVKLARLQLDRCSVERRASHITQNSQRLYNFLLQAEGSSIFYHCGREAELVAGDFVLCDTGLPHFFRTEDHSTTVMVRVPGETLRSYLPTPEQFCGQLLGRASGLTGTIAAMVRELSSGEAGIDANCEDRVARYLLEMISMAYTAGISPSEDAEATAIAWQRHKTVLCYIEDNLRDPELSPATISERLKVSPRYLRAVFSPGGEKMGAYILRRRLEECARQMANPAWKAHTLTEIAFSWGFNSAAHFTRTFHEKYGMAPREYRRVMLMKDCA